MSNYLDKLNRFVSNPVNVDIRRSMFNRDSQNKLTLNAGELVPIYLDEVLPGDSFNMDVSSLVRSITPAVPVMDNSFMDIYFFWCPNRILVAHPKDWEKIFGENTNGFWAPNAESTLKNTGNTVQLKSVMGPNSIGAYLGLPVVDFGNSQTYFYEVSRLPLAAYEKCYNEWFRDQNVQAPVSGLNYEDPLLLVNKIHDYFTSCLPSPQKGDSVLLPIADYAPVITRSGVLSQESGSPLFWRNSSGGIVSGTTLIGIDTDGSTRIGEAVLGGTPAEFEPYPNITGIHPSNLWADLRTASAVSVNEMRQAFAIQRLLEKDARGGTRYREMLKAHFGVSIPDNTVQVPEYLGGKRIPLNMNQVLQTSETGTTPLGSTGAFSNTYASDKLFVKSFVEYGYIIGFACIRTEQSYSQGIPRHFFRNRRYEWYHPVFANLGEQAVKTTELFTDGNYTDAKAAAVFGYQEAWAEYRYKPNQVTGYFAPGAEDTILSAWTYTNNFTAAPTLNSSFMQQPRAQVDKTLVVSNADYQYLADFYFKCKCTRPMPLYSVPGLIDHH